MSASEPQSTVPTRTDPRSTEELVRLALTETDENAAREPIVPLHFRATREVLESARFLCQSANEQERRIGADILGQLGIPQRAFPEECFNILSGMLEQETSASVLNAIAVAFGHLKDPRSIPLLAGLRVHSDPDVRFGVVFGLLGHDNTDALRMLIELSSDQDSDVRDWATFGLGSMVETDSPEIRSALLARVIDTDCDTRCEALMGLARRQDERVVEPLIRELNAGTSGSLLLDAAEIIDDSRVAAALAKWKSRT